MENAAMITYPMSAMLVRPDQESERYRRTSRGACRGSRQIPRVERRAEYFVKGVGAGAEFRGVRFGVDHPAIVFEMFDHDIRMCRDVIPIDR